MESKKKKKCLETIKEIPLWIWTHLLYAKDYIRERGILYSLLHFLFWFSRLLWGVFIYKKKYPSDDIEEKEWIFNEWEKQWISGFDEMGRDYFYSLFKYDYEDTCKKIRRNKKNNFRMKFICVLPLIIAVILCLAGILVYNTCMFFAFKGSGEFLQNNNRSFSIYSTVPYAVAVILTVVTAKWIGVKKYQETWIRHSNHKYIIDMEMYKFIQRLDEYSGVGRKECFRRNIMKTWDKNQKKFSENMKKEEGMMDIVKGIKK